MSCRVREINLIQEFSINIAARKKIYTNDENLQIFIAIKNSFRKKDTIWKYSFRRYLPENSFK